MSELRLTRRDALAAVASAAVGGSFAPRGTAAARGSASPPEPFALRYILASSLYGTMPLDVILPEVRKAGASAIDVWCKPHGDQREQADAIGLDAFAALLKRHDVPLGVLTRYPLGGFGLADEMAVAKRLGARLIVTGTGGPKGVSGDAAKREMRAFLEKMKPHAARAEELGVVIALENHGGSMLSHPDSIRSFAEFNRSPALGVAFAPHHLHAWDDQIPALINELGKQVVFLYAQEHGRGFVGKLPKDQEMMQLPGHGGRLDYRPVVAALKKIEYAGWVEIFMHPTPRGVPILPTPGEITAAVNKSRAYLDACVRGASA